MKFNPLRDWHFTLSMESPFEQANVFLNSLDIISWQNSNYNALESAVEQLSLLDDYYKIYAFPQVFEIKHDVIDNSSKKILHAFCNEFILSIDKSFNDLSDKIDVYDRISRKFNNEDAEKLNNYQDIYQYKNISTFLSILYVNINKNPDLLHAYQIEKESEEYNSLVEFVDKAYNYQYGRFSFIIASRIIKLVDFENFKTKITDHIFKNVTYTDIHLNPDLTELIIDGSFDTKEILDDIEEDEQTDEEINHIAVDTDSNKDILTKKVSDEFYNLQLFDELSERNKKENDYYFEQLREPIKPNNETPFYLRKKALKITYWQFTLLNNFFIREPKISLTFFKSIIIEPESKINFWNIPEDNYNLKAVYNLKNIFGRQNKDKKKYSLDKIKKQIYSPLPKIEFKDGILYNNPKWFEHSDDTFLYLRTTLFGYLSAQYYTSLSINDSDTLNALIKLTVYNMRFHEEYGIYIKQRNHKDYQQMLTNMKSMVDKVRKSNRTFYACIGTEKQLSITRLLYERTKSVSAIQDVNIFEIFNKNTSSFKPNYKLAYKSTYRDIYTNVLLPNVIYNWIYIIYQSLQIDNKVLPILSSIIKHESSIKKPNGQTFYSYSYFNKTRLCTLYSFFEDSLNFDFYESFSFKNLRSKIQSRNVLTASTENDLDRLDAIDDESLLLYKSVRQLEIINKHSIDSEEVENILNSLYKELASIIETKELDRYVRIQLIKLLNNTLLLKFRNDSLREQILYLILEYGGIYDNDLLFKIIFTNIDDKLLQNKLIYAYYALLKKGASNTNMAISPYSALYNKNKLDFIKNKLHFLAYSETRSEIHNILTQNNIESINSLYSKYNGYYQEPIDNLSPSIAINSIHSIYYDPNSYATSILIKGEEPLAQTFSGRIELHTLNQTNWNSLEKFKDTERILFNKETKEYKKSEWFVDIFGIKKELIKKEYKVIAYKINNKKLNPFPLNLFQFICEFPEIKNDLRLVLVDDNYQNPITGIKGSLWSYAVGKNIFLTKDEFNDETLDKLNQIFKNITEKYDEINNPTKSLVISFKVIYNNGLKLSIKNDEELEVNIDIFYNLLPTVDNAYKKDGKWYINLKENGVTDVFENEIQCFLNFDREDSFDFYAHDFLWNPLINEIREKVNIIKAEKRVDTTKELPKQKTNYKKTKSNNEKNDYNLEKLDNYLNQNEYSRPNIEAKIDNSGNIELLNISLPQDLILPATSNTKWTKKFNRKNIPRNIILSSFSPNRYFDTFFNDFKKGYNAFVDIRNDRNNLKIHTQKVRPYTLKSFSAFFETLNEKQKRKFQITYIGQYDRNNYYHLKYNPNDKLKEYVFEFGYGRIIILNKNEIVINKNSIAKYGSIIFYGDRLKRIEIIDDIINCYKIEFDTSKLYNESLNKNIIHTLYIDSKTKKIKKVISTDYKLNISKSYANYRGLMKLSSNSKSEINEIEYQSDEIILYAKINEKTDFRTIEFDIIKLSNNNDSLNNKLLFFRAENISYENNTYKLKIIPLLDENSSSFVENNFVNNCYIKKRDFSSEANTLVNLYRERLVKTEEFSSLIKDEIFLVHLSYDNTSNKYNYSLIGSRESIVKGNFNMPIRNEYILSKKLDTETITAVVINRNYGRKYRVELRPGIFVEVEISNKKDVFIHGDVIKIVKINEKIYFKLLIPSDSRFFDGTKLISILPKNNIVEIDPEKNPEDFYDRKHFIASEFANIELQLRNTNSLLPFLSKKNKYALINKFIANIDIPPNFNYKLVELRIKNNQILITSFDKKYYRIDYRQISFSEKPYQKIIELLIHSNWKYVDSKTNIWNFKWKRIDLTNNRYTNTFVPAYNFQDNKITFRYPIYADNQINIEEISKISLPSNVLVNHLRNSDKRICTVTFVCEYHNKIFLEISPARIVEIRKDYLKLLNSTFGLNNFPNQILGTGDSLKLRLKEINHYNYEIDTIEVLEWNPSGRSSFNERSLLPMIQGDGFVKFGENMFSFIMPDNSTINNNKKNYYFVNTHINFFKKQKTEQLSNNSTSLLYHENNNLRITVPFIDDYEIIISEQDEYLKDWFSSEKVMPLLEVVGGYLPITINKVDKKEKKIYISRKLQTKVIIENRDILLSSLIGKLNEDTILLKSGTILLPFDINSIADLIPKEVMMNDSVLMSIVKYLKNRFYITKVNNEFIHGLNLISTKEEKDYDCSLLNFVNTKEHTGIILITKTNKTLHFVEYKNISWIKSLSDIDKYEIMKSIFKGNYLNEIKLNINKSNSLTDTGKAKSEFNSLYKGKTITIEYVTQLKNISHPTDGYKYYLVRSKFSGIVMLAESSLDEKNVKKISMALVIDYSKKDKTLLVAIGEKSIMLDTYHLLFNNSNYNHNEIKEEFKQLLVNQDFDALLSIGSSLLNETYLSVFKPLYYLKYVYSVIADNYDNPKINELKKIYSSIVNDISIRALRERHTEILVSNWLNNKTNMEREGEFWSRINKIGKKIFSDNNSIIDKDYYRSIENFNKVALPLRRKEDRQGIIDLSNALMVAIGQNDGIVLNSKNSPIVSSIVKLSFKYFEQSIDIFKTDSFIDSLEDIIKQCELNGYFYLRKKLLTN